MSKIIITGGNGFVGTRIQNLLREKGIDYSILTRKPKNANEFLWNIEEKYIDMKVFDGALAIIHLAGENIGDKRWTASQKERIIKSRVDSSFLLYDYLRKENHNIETFVAASGASYYGDGSNNWQNENMQNGSGFLADVSVEWERASLKISTLNIRTCILRTGVTLDKQEGALPKIMQAINVGIGAYFGNGKQYLPWIHIDDLVAMYFFVLEQKNINGIYNAVAPNPVSNKELMQLVVKQMNRWLLPFGVPAVLLKTILGEMADVLLISNRCSAEKILNEGFEFQHQTIETALAKIIRNKN